MKTCFIFANSEDPDEMPHYAAFHQGLHCLLSISSGSLLFAQHFIRVFTVCQSTCTCCRVKQWSSYQNWSRCKMDCDARSPGFWGWGCNQVACSATETSILNFLYTENVAIILSRERKKMLIRLHKCTGWSWLSYSHATKSGFIMTTGKDNNLGTKSWFWWNEQDI